MWFRQCANFKTTLKKSAHSSRNLLSNTPRERRFIYRLINNRMDGYSRLHEGISAKRPTNIQLIDTHDCAHLSRIFWPPNAASRIGDHSGATWNCLRRVAWSDGLQAAR